MNEGIFPYNEVAQDAVDQAASACSFSLGVAKTQLASLASWFKRRLGQADKYLTGVQLSRYFGVFGK